MNFNIAKHTVFLSLIGSRGYGFATATSDYDYRGIAIAPIDSYLGLDSNFEQSVSKTLWQEYPEGLVQPEADMQVMELRKFNRLALECNPSVIEILFSEDVVYQHPIISKLLELRQDFLSKRIKPRFSGYALSQLKRINLHKRWLDNPPTHQPTREEFGLNDQYCINRTQLGAIDALVRQQVEELTWDLTDIPAHLKLELSNQIETMLEAVTGIPTLAEQLEAAAVARLNFSSDFLELLNREKAYRRAKQDWKSYQTWKTNRNPDRAVLEAKMGYDGKHASHLVRLLRMCREILETGRVLVKRPDAEELLAIRNGAWTYEQLVTFAKTEDQALEQVMKDSQLPSKPNFEKIHQVTVEMIQEFQPE